MICALWNVGEPPKNGTVIVAIGHVACHDAESGWTEPFALPVKWVKADSGFEGWLHAETDLSVQQHVGDEVHIHHWMPLPGVNPFCGVDLIAAERARQVSQEGWSPEHDDWHDIGELASAAACYLVAGDCIANASRMNPDYHCTAESVREEIISGAFTHLGWPWAEEWLKIDADPIRSLVKAGALIAAEIDRLQRCNAGGQQ
jgi:hypothetical protein